MESERKREREREILSAGGVRQRRVVWGERGRGVGIEKEIEGV